MEIRFHDQVIAESRAYRKLLDEFERYARQQLLGGSVLISGHRGSGKTTLVTNAIAELQDKLLSRYGDRYRILKIPLHGPDLLSLRSFSTKINGTPDTQSPAPTDPDNKEEAVIKNVLEHVTVALYRALANEFYAHYRRKILTSPRASELKELIGRLRLELDESPDLSTLRALWHTAGFIEDGVLFDRDAEQKLDIPPDQGIQEIVLLSSTAQAFRIITGSQEDKRTSNSDQSAEIKTVAETKTNSKEMLNAILGILSGVAVGIGVAQVVDAELKVLLSSITGVLTALLANFTLTKTATFVRKRSTSKEYKFIRNRDIASLNREIPNLIRRVQEVGLVPIFVVDELDKSITPPFEDFGNLIAYLKKLVSENAFFCFLTDRNYFNFISSVYQKNKYPREYTYFTHRFYVNYSPADFHEYLDNCFQLRSVKSDSLIDAVFLKYIILNRANLHTIDVKREILNWCEQGTISVNDVMARDTFRYPVMVQLAIECVLEDQNLTARLEQDPYFSQLIKDALYYPVRSWLSGEKKLDMSRDKFDKYIRERNENLQGKEASVDPMESVTEADLEFLHKKVDALIRFLADPEQLTATLNTDQKQEQMAKRYNNKTIWQNILQAIPKNDKEIPLSYLLLVREPTNASVYEWKFDYYGRPIADRIPDVADINKKIEVLEKFSSLVERHVNIPDALNVLARNQIIHTTPSWASVQQAIVNLKQFTISNAEYSGLRVDFRNLNEYYTNLTRRTPLLAKTLVVGKYLRKDSPDAEWNQILSILGNALDLKLGENTVELDKILKQITPLTIDFEGLSKINDVGLWTRSFDHLIDVSIGGATNIDQSQLQTIWWSRWEERLLDYFLNGKNKVDIDLNDLISMISNIGFARLFGRDINAITRQAWSQIMIDILRSRQPLPIREAGKTSSAKALPSPKPVAYWMLAPALLQLGFNDPDFLLRLETGRTWSEIATAQRRSFRSSTEHRYIILVTQNMFIQENNGTGLPLIQVDYSKWKSDLPMILDFFKKGRGQYLTPILVTHADIPNPDKVAAEMSLISHIANTNSFILLSMYGKSLGSAFKELKSLTEIEKLTTVI